MKRFLLAVFFLFTLQIIQAQLPPWNLEFYVYHPNGQTDTLWVGCDENATAGYDEGLDIIDTTFNTPIAIRGFSQEVEDEFNFGTCVNLKKDIQPFGYPAEFTFYILHDEISTSDSIYIGWDTSMLNYEVGDYKGEGGLMFSENGYIGAIDGEIAFLYVRTSDSTIFYDYQPIPIFISGEYLSCIANASLSIMKIRLEINFKDYSSSFSSYHISNKLHITPNPASEKISIESTFKTSLQASIYDSKGYLLDSLNIIPGFQQIDISYYPPGIYFIKMISNNSDKLFNYKIIKQ